jgi:hypothetical protein
MSAALKKIDIESKIAARFGDAFKVQEKSAVETLSTGIDEVDLLIGGIPRGALSEISGVASSGRTSLYLSILAQATTQSEICALVDVHDLFSPSIAVSAGVDPDRLLWIRCNANLEHAFKATDLLLHAGGFSLVILDMGDVPEKEARRIISSWWYRFRRTVENKPTALVVISEASCTHSCAFLSFELRGTAGWSNSTTKEGYVSPISRSSVTHANLLRTNSIRLERKRPLRMGTSQGQFRVSAVNR